MSPSAKLPRTQALARLLQRVARALTLNIWLYGLGSILLVCTAWLSFAFFADWVLHVPRPVRLLHLCVLLILPLLVGWRVLIRPLRRRPDSAGLAVLVERSYPELKELLVSAVQLQGGSERASESPSESSSESIGPPAREGAALREQLIDHVCAQAESESTKLEPAAVLAPKQPRWRFASGFAASALLALAAIRYPLYASIFASRFFGGEASWPQRTVLSISLPALAERAYVEERAGEIFVRLARGSDVPLLVRAEGEVPEDVTIHFDGGAQLLLAPGADGLFRTVLRSLQEATTFWAIGGDDRDGAPRVRIEVLQPPEVAGLAVTIEPPEYTALPKRIEQDRDVAVPAGSRISVAMLPEPAQVQGVVRILPDDRVIELLPVPFATQAEQETEDKQQPPPPPQMGLGFEWLATSSIRYRFELVDGSGLKNPDPGLFAVHVAPDRNPEVEILLPSRMDFDTTRAGSLTLRASARDDYAVVSMGWRARETNAEHGTTGELTFEPATQGSAVLARRRIEIAELASNPLEGEQYLLEVFARDNRPPQGESSTAEGAAPAEEPGLGKSPALRVRIVSAEELMRRIQDRLSRVRTQAVALEQTQREKNARVRELLASVESDSPLLERDAVELSVALNGQRRVQGDAQAILREVASILETVLYARLDDKAQALLEHLDASLASRTDRSFHPEPWRELTQAYAEKRLGTPNFAGALVTICGLCLDISEDETRAAVDALASAALAVEVGAVHAALTTAHEHQQAALASIELLLERLSEWDNFQSILSLTRDILNRQKTLMERTRQEAMSK